MVTETPKYVGFINQTLRYVLSFLGNPFLTEHVMVQDRVASTKNSIIFRKKPIAGQGLV